MQLRKYKNYPEHLKNINLENINTQATNDAIEKQIELMITREEIKKLIDKKADLRLKLDDNDALLKEASGLSKAWAAVQMAFNGFGGASNTIRNAVDNVKSDISQQITDIDKLVKQKMDEIGSSGATTGLVETTKDKVTKSVSESITIAYGRMEEKTV